MNKDEENKLINKVNNIADEMKELIKTIDLLSKKVNKISLKDEASINLLEHFKLFMSKMDRMFFSKNDLLFNFGKYLDTLDEIKDVLFKYPIQGEAYQNLDLLLIDKNNKRIGIKFQYKTKSKEIDIHGDVFSLKNHAAQDITRLHSVKYISKLESLIDKSKVDKAFLILFSNDQSIWNGISATKEPIDKDFRFYDLENNLRTLKGHFDSDVSWFKKEMGNEGITLRGSYAFEKREVKDSSYCFSIVEVN